MGQQMGAAAAVWHKDEASQLKNEAKGTKSVITLQSLAVPKIVKKPK